MSIEGELLHRHLRWYKDDRSSQVRARMSLRLAALVSVFMRNHGDCVGPFESVVSVPSSTRTAMEAILQRIPALRDEYRPALQVSGSGSKTDVRADRFTVTREVRGERILVLDDTFTRGPTLSPRWPRCGRRGHDGRTRGSGPPCEAELAPIP